MKVFTAPIVSVFALTLPLALPLGLAACATSEPPQPALSADMSSLTPERTAEIGALNAVASLLIDAETGYRDAARMPDNEPRVRKSLNALADQRAEELLRVQRRVGVLGGEPDQFGGAMGAPSRLYADLQTIVSNDTRVALDSVLRTERALMKRIKRRLPDAETATSKKLLRTIHGQVAADIRALERLKAEET
ncbi:MAG: DUF2383 domain-containing protein [Pseudomonadota bacterium]